MFKYQLTVLLLFVLLTVGCSGKKEEQGVGNSAPIRDLPEIIASDTLRVATMYGADSYFVAGNNVLGYHWEMLENFAAYLHLSPKIQVAQTEQELKSLLLDNQVDLIAYPVTLTKEVKENHQLVYPISESHMVLIQRLSSNSLLDVTDLAGKDIYVKANTVFQDRLESLNEEIGGTINIILAPDSLRNDELIENVLNGDMSYTVAYYDYASMFRIFYQYLDYHVPVGFEQKRGWLIRKDTPSLHDTLNVWKDLPETRRLQQKLTEKYSKKNPIFSYRKVRNVGSISPYDDLFKEYAPVIGWDWRLLAALAFQESTFDPLTVSRVGAAGLMQLMPQTAQIYGLDSISVFDPEENVRASVELIRRLDRVFSKVENKDERVKFVLAAYNGGLAHILDAMALAERYGKNPYIWFDNVEYFLNQKKEPDFYQDSIVRFGSFNANETVWHVRNVLSIYETYLDYQ